MSHWRQRYLNTPILRNNHVLKVRNMSLHMFSQASKYSMLICKTVLTVQLYRDII
ncbi:hypothetical protein C0J52_05607 [Blattella germanica]|nr:hypothetical protein C0J52_05607 [Blattella germanica]